jgi:GTP pyrophosphokinase
MIRQYELVDRVKTYDVNADEALLNRAYVFAMKAHGEQKRHSGDPYFAHPIEVAGILTDLKLDSSTIVTALLHDTIEDTLATYDDLEESFGGEIAALVNGVTKLSQLELTSEASKQAENFRKLLVAMSKDVRVLLVKLADRLHNMRTLSFVPGDERRRRIAQETMDIYAPLAARMGMQEIREELEDLSFAELKADARDSVTKRLEFLRSESGDMIAHITEQLKTKLAENNIEAMIIGREKRPFSIWRKMESKAISFEQLSDIIGFRVVVPTVEDCYRALGVFHSTWQAVPGRFKDYISIPKRNNYRSLHTLVIGPEKQRVEIQIRTNDMHDVAEHGVAAHWSYKDKVKNGGLIGGDPYLWLRELVEMLEHGDSPEEFLEHTKLEMFQDQVFCFTPKGELIALPQGATPIDFAYAVHTDVGDTCVGAKINGHHVPLRTRLQNGDEVEIIRSKVQQPVATWESLVVTGKARSAIRRFVRQSQRKEFVRLGRSILERAFENEEEKLSAKKLKGFLRSANLQRAEELYYSIGQGEITSQEVLEAVYPEKIKPAGKRRPRRPRPPKKGANVLGIRGLIPGLSVHIAPCCHPLPGDRIVGIVTKGKGITVHTIDCETLEEFSNTPDRWLDVAWDEEQESDDGFSGRLRIVLNNEPGSLGTVSSVIAQNEGNITNLRLTSRMSDFFEMLIDIQVHDVKHLNSIIAALNATTATSSVARVRG